MSQEQLGFETPGTGFEQAVLALEESARWKARDVSYWEGTWDRIRQLLPAFATEDFKTAADGPANPHLKVVVRQPKSAAERSVPVGVVSTTYTLAQHADVGARCLEGIRDAGIDATSLRCQVGLTELGEWMNLRIYFPADYEHRPRDGQALGLRLECFNSVDGSSRLVLFLGWLRFVCANGLVIGETKAELKDIHNKHMDLNRIPAIVREGLGFVQADLQRLERWERQNIALQDIEAWANQQLSAAWGKKAACRTYHICKSGHDVEFADPFAKGAATEKPVEQTEPVPGAPIPAQTLYDVSQALSWVATHRKDADRRLDWQSSIPSLVDFLHSAA